LIVGLLSSPAFATRLFTSVLAKKDRFLVYSSFNAAEMVSLRCFEKKYPGVKVEHLRLAARSSCSEYSPNIRPEEDWGRHGPDQGETMHVLGQKGLPGEI